VRNAPFELEPSGSDTAGKEKKYRRGILLTHGLSDSPYFMRYLAAFFQSNGYRVMAVLLPGHGTRPGDMLDVSWQEWAKAVAYGTDQLAAEVDEVYLGGYSAGGALSIYQSLLDKRVRACRKIRAGNYPRGSHAPAQGEPDDPRQKWAYQHIDIHKYEFAKILRQMYQLTLAVRQLKQHERISTCLHWQTIIR
jgi:pimeloyl-ACP methyl ester carboxylesterase